MSRSYYKTPVRTDRSFKNHTHTRSKSWRFYNNKKVRHWVKKQESGGHVPIKLVSNPYEIVDYTYHMFDQVSGNPRRQRNGQHKYMRK